jgi:replicative DNA helicase
MEKRPIIESEGAALDAVLEELQSEHAVKEISGWETGFANLSRALDGMRPGLYLFIGPPASGKTAFAKQLLDQTAMHSRVAGMYFSFAETKKELRIKTLARLSGLDQREIRRGSAYLLHWYGVPRLAGSEASDLPPSWEKLKRSAEDAKSWLDLSYLIECKRGTTVQEIETQIVQTRAGSGSEQLMIVVDDCQRLGAADQPLDVRLPIIAEQLQETAVSLNAPVLAVWPSLDGAGMPAQAWGEKVASPDAILVLEKDLERSNKLTEPNQAVTLHIVKNRGGEKGKLAYDFFPVFARFSEV